MGGRWAPAVSDLRKSRADFIAAITSTAGGSAAAGAAAAGAAAAGVGAAETGGTGAPAGMGAAGAATETCPAPPASRSARAIMSSRCNRGAVAPTMVSSVALTVSAMRDSCPGANFIDCSNMRCSWSSGTPRNTEAAPCTVVAEITMRSRRRSSRSSTKRRGSCPVCTMRSVAAKASAGLPEASASTAASMSSALAKPSRPVARSSVTRPSSLPAMS